jgi:hemolysin activation/secretion protein
MTALAALLLAANAAPPRTLEILEYRVQGATQLSQVEIEAAVYPFLGPGRTFEDIEKARLSLEKVYTDKGFQSVTVAIPRQTVRGGVVQLVVTEAAVGRLRVRNAHWFLPSDIKHEAPSVAEGTVPNFNDIVRDIFVLNQMPDRRVVPSLRPGFVPGTVDVDLDVQDQLPLHGSLELNNRFSQGTTPARLNGNLRYDNLFQLGHSLSFSFQVAPQRLDDAKVFSGSYLARFPGVTWFTLGFNGLWQDSDISTLGATAVRGRGRVFGGTASFTLPPTASLLQTINFGLTYKHFGSELDDPCALPIVYWPLNAQYTANLTGDGWQSLFSGNVVFSLRGLGSTPRYEVTHCILDQQTQQPTLALVDPFDSKRFKGSGSFIYGKLDLSHTQEAGPVQLFVRGQAQIALDPLLPAEQLTAGGVDSVRGYIEAQAAGDYGMLGSVEVRSPSLTASWLKELRVHAFFEGGRVALRDTRYQLPDQQWLFLLWSTGGGARMRMLDHWSGSLDVGVPLRDQGSTHRYHPRAQFRLVAEF